MPVAFVIPVKQSGAERLGQDLSNYVRSQMGDYNIPVRWVFKTELPLPLNGKIDYRALEREAEEGNVTIADIVLRDG